MKKEKLVNFISKYSLGGLCNQVKVTSKSGKLYTSFATDQKDLLGFVVMSDVDVKNPGDTTLSSDFQFGIFNTSVLSRVLSAMQPEINVEFKEEYGKIVSMHINDNVMQSQIMLADLEIIDTPPSVNELPPTDITLNISSIFIDQFIKAKNALPDSDTFAFVQNEDSVNLVVNYAEHNTDKITLKMDIDDMSSNIPVMKFNANLVKEIFTANKDCVQGKISLSSQGLMNVTFQGEAHNTKYLLVMLQN
jgi:hypothetical protein